MPISKLFSGKESDRHRGGFRSRETLSHLGPYGLCESYEKIFDHSKSIDMKINYPIGEIYIKGRG